MNDIVETDTSLVIVALFDDTYIDDIFLGLTSISGGRVIMLDAMCDAAGISPAIPMFAELLGMGGKKHCKLLFSAVHDPQPAVSLIKQLNDAGIDFVGLKIGEIYTIRLDESVLVDEIDI